MDPLQFAYWLQGFAELNNGVPPNEAQWKAIRDHLNLVFMKKTPATPVYRGDDSMSGTTPYVTPRGGLARAGWPEDPFSNNTLMANTVTAIC